MASSSAFLARVRAAISLRHYGIRTEQAYLHWVKRFIQFHRMRHPDALGEAEVAAFLSHLAVTHEIAPAMQNQALNTLVFLYAAVPERPLGELDDVLRAKPGGRLPVVLSVDEASRVLARFPEDVWLTSKPCYRGYRQRQIEHSAATYTHVRALCSAYMRSRSAISVTF